MSDIFEEVDESIRQDRLEIWWKRYQFFVYGAVALVIGAVAVNEFVIMPRAEAARTARALELETALSELHNGSYAAAEAAFADLADGGSKLAPLAANYLAQVRFEGGGDADGAAEALAAIGAVEGSPFDRLALLKKAYFKADGQSMTELEATLGSLVDDEGPLGALARELVAAKAFATGDTARARTEFNRLRFDAAAPAGAGPNSRWPPSLWLKRPHRPRMPTARYKKQKPKRRLPRPPLQSLRRLVNESIA